MAYDIGDSIQETSTTTGTGTAKTLDGAVSGFRTAASKLSSGDTATWALWDDTDEEIFEGTFTSGPDTVTRTDMISSTNGGDPVDWGAGTRNIACVVDGEKLRYLVDPSVQTDFGGMHRIAANDYIARIPTMTPGNAVTLTNPDGVSGVPAFNDSNAAALDGSAFTGAVSFAALVTLANAITRVSGIDGSNEHVTRYSSDGTDLISKIKRITTDSWQGFLRVGAAWKRLITEVDVPISGLNEGEILIADSATSYTPALLRLLSNADNSLGGDSVNRAWVIEIPIVDTDGSTLRTLKIQGDTETIGQSTTIEATLPSAFDTAALGVIACFATNTGNGNACAYLNSTSALTTVQLVNAAGSGGNQDVAYVAWGV